MNLPRGWGKTQNQSIAGGEQSQDSCLPFTVKETQAGVALLTSLRFLFHNVTKSGLTTKFRVLFCTLWS